METGSVPRCNGSLWKTCRKEASHSEAQCHKPAQKLLFITSGPDLRGSRSDLSNRGVVVLCNEGFVDSSWVLSPVGQPPR